MCIRDRTNIGMPVPQGFTISTEACTRYYEDGEKIAPEIEAEIFEYLAKMEDVYKRQIIGRAAKKGAVEINCVQIRDYTENKQMQVDDYPYGGGWGLVMMAQPLKSCLCLLYTSRCV